MGDEHVKGPASRAWAPTIDSITFAFQIQSQDSKGSDAKEAVDIVGTL